MSDLRSVLRLLVSESAPEIVKRAHSPHIDMTVRSTWEEKIFKQINEENFEYPYRK